MRISELDNPVWEALQTIHSGFAERYGPMVRYRAAVLPFCAVESAAVELTEPEGLEAGEKVCFFGPVPERLPARWSVAGEMLLVQMLPTAPLVEEDGLGIVALSGDDAEEMMRLKAAAFPGYFGLKTWRLGDYFGIWEGGRLVAMAGSRLAFPGMREISAVCTHPDYIGRGYARALMARVTRAFEARGERPFLHTAAKNARARGIYERVGFVTVGEVSLTMVQRMND